MGIKIIFAGCLISALAGCVHLTEAYEFSEESDAQKLMSFAQQFTLLRPDKKVAVCKYLSQYKALRRDPLARVKQAYLVAIYPPCGRLEVAIANLEQAKKKTLDHELGIFIGYQIAVMQRIKKDKEESVAYKNQLDAAQNKLDEIKSIEKTLNSREN